MIELLDEFPDHVVAVRAQGQVTGEDYSTILIPAVEQKIREDDKVRLFYQIGPDFKRFTTTALWEDAEVGFHHLESFERIAIVTDVGWIETLAAGVGQTMPGKLRVFPLADIENATAWISAHAPS